MTRVTIDSSMQAKLQGDAPLIVCNEAGDVLGYFQPVGKTSSGIRSPISDEEIERRRQRRAGSPLADVLQRLSEK